MEFQAKNTVGTGPLSPAHHAQAEVLIMLQAFENELDALLKLIDTERNDNISEGIYRRYVTANDIHLDLVERYQRIGFKMDMVSEHVIGGFDGGGVLEGTGKPDTETP